MEADQIDVFASAVLGGLEQVQNTEKSRLPCQFWSNVRKPNRFDRVHFNFTFLHAVAATRLDVGTNPDPHAAGDFPATNSLAEPLSEHHAESLHALAAHSPPAKCNERHL